MRELLEAAGGKGGGGGGSGGRREGDELIRAADEELTALEDRVRERAMAIGLGLEIGGCADDNDDRRDELLPLLEDSIGGPSDDEGKDLVDGIETSILTVGEGVALARSIAAE